MSTRWFILRCLLKRDLLPATSGSGLSQWLTYRMVVSILPTLGILGFIFMTVFGILAMVAERQGLERRLEMIRTSPYRAIFAEGQFFTDDSLHPDNRREEQLSYWRQTTADTVNGSFSDSPIFRMVTPFSECQLQVKVSSKNVLLQEKGLAILFSGDDSDQILIEYMESQVDPPLERPLAESLEGIIISEKAAARFSVHVDQSHLLVRHRMSESFVAIPILGVLPELPYESDYVMSLKQWRRLRNSFYDHERNFFEVSLGNDQRPEKIVRLPEGWQWDLVSSDDGVVYQGLFLPVGQSISSLRQWAVENKLKSFFDDADANELILYTGAMFHLRYDFLDEQPDRGESFLLLLSRFLRARGIVADGALIRSLVENMKDRRQFMRMLQIMTASFSMLFVLQFVFFWLQLHSKMHRIGVVRMLGTSDGFVTLIYLIEGALVWSIAFVTGFLIIKAVGPFGLSLSMDLQAALWIGLTLFVTLAAFLMPIVLFLKILSPQEMIDYRS